VLFSKVFLSIFCKINPSTFSEPLVNAELKENLLSYIEIEQLLSKYILLRYKAPPSYEALFKENTLFLISIVK
jgi:hypothetical protein